MKDLQPGKLTVALGALLLLGTALGTPTIVLASTTRPSGHGIDQTWGYGYPNYGPTTAGGDGYAPYSGYQYPGYSGTASSSASPTASAAGASDSNAAATALVVCEAFFWSGNPSECERRVFRTFYTR